MLKATSDRVDYGAQLRPPEGYVLDAGIATSYSIELETLVAASMALSLDQTLEGDLSGEKLALLESLDRLQGRLLVFYQAGRLKIPPNFNRLFGLLEPLLVPVPTSQAFASFHPKLWLLRFTPTQVNEPVRFRLMILTRNLTGDRSWDLAVVLDGKATEHNGNTDSRLMQFIHALPKKPEHDTFVTELCRTLDRVQWDIPSGFGELQILPGTPAQASSPPSVPFELNGEIEDLLVVSPFVDAGPGSMLNHLEARAIRSRTLISRADTLDRIGPATLKNWNCISVANAVVDGEERLEQDKPARHDLHAKLFVASVGKVTTWHVGSPNMTNAAMGKPQGTIAPRNVELAVRLTGETNKIGAVKLLTDWLSSGAFVQHEFEPAAEDVANSDAKLRQLIFELVSSTWALSASAGTKAETFALTLKIDPVPSPPPGFEIEVDLLSDGRAQPLHAEVSWQDVLLTDISAFVSVEVRARALGVTERFAIQASLGGDVIEARRKAVFKSIVDTPEKVLRYMTLLLDTQASKSQWLKAGEQNGNGADIFGLNLRGGLYEQLLRSASRAPHRLKRVLILFERLREQQAPLPQGLGDLLASFAATPGAVV